MMRIIFLFMVVVLWHGACLAANDAQEKIFQNYITLNTLYKKALDVQYKRLFQYHHPECGDDIQSTRYKPVVLQAASFAAAHPYQGQWIEKTALSSCGQKMFVNILVSGIDDEKLPLLLPLLNGRSQVSLKDQLHIQNLIHDSLKQEKSPCILSPLVMDSNVIGYKAAGEAPLSKTDEGLGWFELWNVNHCNKSEQMIIAVLPDPKKQYRYVIKKKE